MEPELQITLSVRFQLDLEALQKNIDPRLPLSIL